MHPRFTWWWAALVLGTLGTSVTAQDAECHGTTVYSSGHATELYEHCTSIDGNIYIHQDYKGPFTLPNTVNMTGSITATSGHASITVNQITTVEAPNLLQLGGLQFSHTGSLKTISLPNVTTITGLLEIKPSADYATIDLGSLTEVGGINLWGEWTRFNFDSLKRVGNGLEVEHCYYCDRTLDKALELSFPSLEFAGFIRIQGVISNISMPQLASVGPPDKPAWHSLGGSDRRYDGGVWLRMADIPRPFAVIFSKLQSIDQKFKVDGKIEDVSLPALQETNANIALTGNISSVELDNLSRFSSLNVNSQADFDCSAFLTNLTSTTGYPEDGSRVNCLPRTTGGGDGSGNGSGGLSRTAQILIGVIVPVAVVLFAVMLWLWRRRASSQQQSDSEKKEASPASPASPEPTPPAYKEADERESSPPPPYRRAPEDLPRE